MNNKKWIILMIFIYLILTGCSQNTTDKTYNSKNQADITKPGNKKPQAGIVNEAQVESQTKNEPKKFILNKNRYNSFMGMIGNNKIRILMFLDNNNQITGSYFYEKYQQKIIIKGNYENDLIRLTELDPFTGEQVAEINCVIMDDYGNGSGEWISFNGKKKYNVKLELFSTFPGSIDNIYMDAGAQNTEEVEKFAIELKKNILAKNKERVAENISFPITVEIDGKQVEIKRSSVFVDQFEKIFYPDFIEVIKKRCFPINMDSSYEGIMFGDRGEIWLNYIYEKTIKDAQLKVTTINNYKESVQLMTTEETSDIPAKTIPEVTEEEYVTPKYYTYTGGELPKDIITPIEYIVSEKISLEKPEFRFAVYGDNIQGYGLTVDKDEYYIAKDYKKIRKIVISCNSISFRQELTFSETLIPDIPETTYGFSLDDWNFDGYLDISLWKEAGGTSLNSPHFYWLWDSEQSKYVNNEELENINGDTYISIDKETQQLVADTRRVNGYYEGYYEWRAGNLILVKIEDLTFVDVDSETGKARGHYVIKELMNGEMKVTKDYYKD